MLAAVSVLFALGLIVALRALPDGIERPPIANVGTDQGKASAERRTDAQSAAAISEPAAQEPERRLRFIEKNGVVSVLPDAPLVREEPPERSAPDTTEDGPEPDIHRLVVIEGGGIINARDTQLKLAHVDPPEADRMCKSETTGRWPCGRRARTALRRLVRRRAIACQPVDPGAPPDQDAPPTEARCTVAGTDLSRWLVEHGWAPPSDSAPDAWTGLHEAARAEGRGLYTDAGR